MAAIAKQAQTRPNALFMGACFCETCLRAPKRKHLGPGQRKYRQDMSNSNIESGPDAVGSNMDRYSMVQLERDARKTHDNDVRTTRAFP